MTTSTEPNDQDEVRTVRIPGSTDHGAHHLISVALRWVCPTCGGPRGDITPAISYDGSRRLACDGWSNPCGHIDFYADVRAEAGLNPAADTAGLATAPTKTPHPTARNPNRK